MTEKRYYAHKHLLQENQVHDKICHNFMNIDETVEHMNNQYWKYNQLKEENEQLKEQLRFLQDFRNLITEKNVSNEKERKKLQLQMLRLYNYFENYFEDTMSPNAFSEMWDTVKEDEKWDRG